MKKRLKEGSKGAGSRRRSVLAVVCVAFAAVILAAGVILTRDKAAGDSRAQTVSVQAEDVQTENKGWKGMDTNPLTEETDPEITEAVMSYYDSIAAGSPFAEGYENLKIYTKRGKYEDTYLAFVRYDMKIKDIYTMVPGLETLYIEPDRDTGELQVKARIQDEEAEKAAEILASHDDVRQLMGEVQTAYDTAVASDAILKEALADLENASAGN